MGNILENVNIIDFNKGKGLVPAIVQHYISKEVLMLAYMSKESLIKTFETGTTWFYSRSRNELWNKGATSGNIQIVKEIRIDCDEDTLLILVDSKGVACHTGARSCFYRELNI
ncbi:phosphoribosyl-AMP cyclohydrolase [Clostridium gasigenes]|uniref:Phosphoribosyl-AMP cyclohydrolase n=1 Tax=Clostridium gasigenes TaxID=94869 RepID=A0A1H0S8L3_9CLOT|nr:phosphoribosyl-AMP cyclohydrolase [Clostridium gasigenes]MBU3089483.1 phosphoribosyl-AMP cyclohydrolase [Clostridium gasigenes]MBU3132946.1 phosphoribosyl-AMP cyclohydrolase [Clostridium gasigenes]SDP37558.1 phosphoribosyl-AMP cyclohydrolase [Clostridium gasigenes]